MNGTQSFNLIGLHLKCVCLIEVILFVYCTANCHICHIQRGTNVDIRPHDEETNPFEFYGMKVFADSCYTCFDGGRQRKKDHNPKMKRSAMQCNGDPNSDEKKVHIEMENDCVRQNFFFILSNLQRKGMQDTIFPSDPWMNVFFGSSNLGQHWKEASESHHTCRCFLPLPHMLGDWRRSRESTSLNMTQHKLMDLLTFLHNNASFQHFGFFTT